MKKKDLIKQLVKGPAKSTFGTNPFDPWSAKAGISENILDRFLRSRGIDPNFVTTDQKVSHAKSSDYIKWKKDREYAESVEEVDEAKIKINFKMPPESVADRLYRKQMELRKKRGAPDPEEYKKLGAQKQKEIDALRNEEAEQLDEVGDTKKGQKLLRMVNKRAIDRLVSKKADKDPAYARKAMDTHLAADIRLKEEVTSSTDKLKTDYSKISGHASNTYKKNNKLVSIPIEKQPKGEYDRKVDKYLKKKYNKEEVTSSTDKLKTDYSKIKGQTSNPYKKDVKLTSMPYPKMVKKEDVELDEDLRKWFSKTDPEGDWKRINSKGEAIGPCAREPGEPKPKCMSKEKRASLSKKERASAVSAKRKHDPDAERKGKPINVSNYGKGKIGEDIESLEEKNVPTSPEKWARAKAQAKAKFDVYPSAYANGWASKKYKEMGGGWKSVDENHIAIAMGKELDDEGSMIMNQMDTMEKSISILRGVIKDPKMQVPAWVQSKVTLATDYIESVAGYMSSRNEDVNESFEDEHGIKEVPPKSEREWKKVAQARSEKWRKQQVKRIDEDPLTVEEDTYHDTAAATQMNFDMGNNSYDVEVKSKNPRQVERSKSARIIKSIYKKKNMKEDIYDHEKDDKMTQVMGKKPKTVKMDKDTVGDEPQALVVMSGGKTLTGEPRDTIEIDPLMRGRPGQPKPANKAEKK
jgi:hypothetical protein